MGVAATLAVVIAMGVLIAKAPWRRSPLAPSRYSPVAAELEGVRGVYLYFGLPNSDSLVAEYRDVVVKAFFSVILKLTSVVC